MGLRAMSVCAMVACVMAVARADIVKLAGAQLTAEFDDRGLIAFRDNASGKSLQLAGDGFSVTIGGQQVDSASAEKITRRQAEGTVTYSYESGPYSIDVVYELKPQWRFISKQLLVRTKGVQEYKVGSVEVLRAAVVEPIADEYRHHGGSYGAFLRFSASGAAAERPDRGAFFVVQNPFMVWARSGQRISASYQADMDWKAADGPFASDRICVGTYKLIGPRFPAHIVPEWQYLPDPNRAAQGPQIDFSEIAAVTDCVRAFLLYRPGKSTRVHVPWCENDYQIDCGTEEGRQEYKRIIDQAAAMGCQYMLCTPANSRLSSVKENSDSWGWENVLWLGLGQKIRKGEWDPAKDDVPASVRELLDHAASRHLKLMAYVYPSLPFKQDPSWTKETPGANSASRSFQDWLIDKLVAFQKRTGVGGFCFDYWSLDYKGVSPYAQWAGCRRVLETLRQRIPDVVIDGRQTYQNYGPWTWLAGTYPHPLTNDEQPESFRAFADLHFDRVSADRQRFAAWRYRMDNFCPTEIVPGYMTHQTQRYSADGAMPRTAFRTRDWDYVGWRYSVICSIGTAPFNHVINMIPARDPDELRAFSDADKKWLRDWLDWTDRNADLLRRLRPITGQPMVGRVDGTAAIDKDHGYIFLFNPNQRAMTAEFVLDESIGLSEGKSFLLQPLYPDEGLIIGHPVNAIWHIGDRVFVPMEGAQAMILRIVPWAPSGKPVLFNARGGATLDHGRVELSKVTGPAGHDVTVQVLCPTPDRVASMIINGVNVPMRQDRDVVSATIRFAGPAFDHNQQIGKYDPSFTGGPFHASFSIPARIFDQLQTRKKAWPVPYTDDDLKATWLAPWRLLLFVNVADPNERMQVSMTLDEKPVALQKAYSSIYPQAADRTFVGWYLDVSSLEPDRQHTLALTLPKLAPGQFQGVFFDNVQTEYTKVIEPHETRPQAR